jgi:CheY-like chemotaxis protein
MPRPSRERDCLLQAADIVVVTAAQDVRERAGQIEADGFLGKPFEVDELVRLVQRFCAA